MMTLAKHPKIRKPRSSNSAAQLAALTERQKQKPADAPADGSSPVAIGISLYPESKAQLEELQAATKATSRSHLIRKALAFAAAHQEQFVKEFGEE